MPDTTITLYGATGVATVTPHFVFPSGTVKVYVEDIYIKDLTSHVHDSISLTVGQKLQYVCSNWNSITEIDISTDKVSGDISGWILPTSLLNFFVNSTSISGDISGWVLPASLAYFYVYSTSVSGNISGLVLPASLVTFYVYSTNIKYDSSNLSRKRRRGAFTYLTTTLTKVDFDGCKLTCDQVDNVLADCVISQSLTNELDVGGTNAPPTINGLRSKMTLEARGWTVSVTAGVSIQKFKRNFVELWATAGGAPAAVHKFGSLYRSEKIEQKIGMFAEI